MSAETPDLSADDYYCPACGRMHDTGKSVLLRFSPLSAREQVLREALKVLRPYIKLPLTTGRDYYAEEKFEAALAIVDAALSTVSTGKKKGE